MMTIDLALAVAEVDAMLARMYNMRPALAAIGEEQASQVMLRILQTKNDPDGHAWAPWMPSTAAERARKGNAGQGLLWDKGNLLHSITVDLGATWMTPIVGAGVRIGSSLEYAGFLQDGTRHMTARPIFGWDAEGIAHATESVMNHIRGLPL